MTEPSDKLVSHNDRVVLDCLVQGEPPVDIRWQRNGATLVESNRIRFLPNGSLSLSFVRRGEQSDEGFYQCLARNKYGAILSQRARLTISSEYEKGSYDEDIQACFCTLFQSVLLYWHHQQIVLSLNSTIIPRHSASRQMGKLLLGCNTIVSTGEKSFSLSKTLFNICLFLRR